MLSVDDGIWSGNLNMADVFFLIATIVFAIGFIIVLTVKPLVIDRLMLFAGLVFVALGFLVL